ncbi:MAG: DUF1467 family protein [Pikeienuella sp.]
MSLTSGLAVYAVTWFMVLFMVLPLFMRSQEEAGRVEPGTSAGAPHQPMMKKRLIWTTVVATLIWIAIYLIILYQVITVEDIASVLSRPE